MARGTHQSRGIAPINRTFAAPIAVHSVLGQSATMLPTASGFPARSLPVHAQTQFFQGTRAFVTPDQVTTGQAHSTVPATTKTIGRNFAQSPAIMAKATTEKATTTAKGIAPAVAVPTPVTPAARK